MAMPAGMSARRRSRTESAGNHLETAVRPRVIFTHLFSAPLTELEMANGGSGCQLPKPVPELSYEGERETLVRTLRDSYRQIRFMSEAANMASFARAVGCPNALQVQGRGGVGSSSISLDRSGSDPSGDGVRRDRDGSGGWRSLGRERECRMLHFTGHGQPGKLTFEDKHGQLQYVDEAQLLAMLQCQQPPAASTQACTPGRGAMLAPRAVGQDAHAVGGGYAPFEDVVGGGCGEAQAQKEVDEFCSRSGLQLVFLSSCHSASLAHVFIQAVSVRFFF